MKKILSVILVLVMCMGLMAGCGTEKKETADSSAGEEKEPLVVAVQSFYCSAPVGLIMEKGWAEEYNCPFEIKVFNGGAPINEAMGEWDVAVTGGAFIYALANYDCKLVAHQIDGTGGNDILARNDSPIWDVIGDKEKMAEVVKGSTILTNVGTTGHYALVMWLSNLGLKAGDVNLVSQEFANVYSSWLAGEGDFCVMTPPYSHEDWEEKGSKVVTTLEDEGGKLYEATVCTKDAYENRYDDVKTFVEMLYRACDELAKDPELAFDTTDQWYKDCGKDLEASVIQAELDTKPFVTSAEAEKMDLSEFATNYGEYYIEQGLIESDKLETITGNCAGDLFKEALEQTKE